MRRHANGRYGKYAVMAETLYRMGQEQQKRARRKREWDEFLRYLVPYWRRK